VARAGRAHPHGPTRALTRRMRGGRSRRLQIAQRWTRGARAARGPTRRGGVGAAAPSGSPMWRSGGNGAPSPSFVLASSRRGGGRGRTDACSFFPRTGRRAASPVGSQNGPPDWIFSEGMGARR